MCSNSFKITNNTQQKSRQSGDTKFAQKDSTTRLLGLTVMGIARHRSCTSDVFFIVNSGQTVVLEEKEEGSVEVSKIPLKIQVSSQLMLFKNKLQVYLWLMSYA